MKRFLALSSAVVSAVAFLVVTAVPAQAVVPLSAGPSAKETIQVLHDLGLPTGSAKTTWGSEAVRAVCAWRDLTGREPSRSKPTVAEKEAIVATTPADLAVRKRMVTGINVSRTCQTAVWVTENAAGDRRIKGVFQVSTGMSGHSTPTGVYRINRQINGWHESTGYPGAMMYRPKYFNGGIALHGSYTDSLVHSYPASHGCVRMLHKDIDRLWKSNVGVGTQVRVYGDWRG